MKAEGWTEEFPAAITVCDERGIILFMNGAAAQTFERDGGRGLIGKDVRDCHPEPARSLVADLLANPRPHSYTIEKNGIRKLIYQSPWYRAGRFAGLVELAIVLPQRLAHHVRREAPGS